MTLDEFDICTKYHFGCRLKNSKKSKLTRDNYAIITDSQRVKSFNSLGISSLHGLNYNTVIERYWQSYGEQKLKEYLHSITDYFNKVELVNSSKEKENILINWVKQTMIAEHFEFNIGLQYYETSNKPSLEDIVNNSKLREQFNYDAYIQEIDNTIDKHYALRYIKPRILSFYEGIYGETKSYSSIDLTKLRDCIINSDPDCPVYTNEYVELLRERALENFDINMKYFKSLDKTRFNNEIERFKETYREFVEVTDLNDYKDSPGIYIMVLDEYKQVYIGITRNKNGIKARIQQHWTATKKLDRLIFGGVEQSILSIDSFKHLDTTRIFVSPHQEFRSPVLNNDGTPKTKASPFDSKKQWGVYIGDEYLESEEYKLINQAFSPEFTLNRCAGGGHSLLDAIATRRTHDSE